jgi:hypothetical protein
VTIGLALALLAATGCSDGESPGQPGGSPPTGPTGCAAGELELADGECLPAGVQPSGCLAGELTRSDGSCQPAGIPAELCATGFVSDDDGGCAPVLPAEPCAAGRLAVPGETECHEVAPCLSDPYGEAPVDGLTVYVDGAYGGGSSDGSLAQPWTTIQQAIDVAPAGAVVAIAAGTYSEDLLIEAKPLRLWGRCPDLVEVVGVADDGRAVVVGPGAGGSELHALAITGPGQGIEVTASELLLDRVWIHDSGWRGIYAHGTEGAVSLTITGSLIERATRLGMWIHGAAAIIDATVVRDTESDDNDDYGDGIFVEWHLASDRRGDLELRQSLVTGNRKVGVFVAGADALIEASVVQDTLPAAAGDLGRGVQAQDHSGIRSDLTVRGTVIRGNHNGGVLVYGSDATIEATVVSDTSPDGDGLGGQGVHLNRSLVTGAESSLSFRSSLVARNQEAGIFIEGASSLLEAIAVRDTAVNLAGEAGRGINVQTTSGDRGVVTLRGCAVERSRETGLFLGGVVATVEGTLVRDTFPDDRSQVGLGMRVLSGPEVSEDNRGEALIVHSRLEGSTGFGLAVTDADVRVEGTVVADTVPQAGPLYGDGMLVVASHGATTAEVTHSRVEGSGRAGVACFGGEVSLFTTALKCNPIQLNAEDHNGWPSLLQDQGGNACGCGAETELCHVLSANLAPPETLPSTR